jgi:hypothetical protein
MTANMSRDIASAFQGRLYPQVRRVFLPGDTRGILEACPNVEEVVFYGNQQFQLLKAIALSCHHVRVVDGLLFRKASINRKHLVDDHSFT